VRDSLRRSVRTAGAGAGAGAGASSLAEFWERLADDGLLVRQRYSERNPGQVDGAQVKLPRVAHCKSSPVWLHRQRWGSFEAGGL